MKDLGKLVRSRSKWRQTRFFWRIYPTELARCFAVLDALVNIQYVIVRRLADKRPVGEKAVNLYIGEHSKSHRIFEYHLQTLLTYTKRTEWKQSALKQLSEDLGDANTLSSLMELKQHERELKADLRRAISALKARINERLADG